MRNIRLRKHKIPNAFLLVFGVGRVLETYATFVAAAFFIEYNAPIVTTTTLVTLGAGAMLCVLQDIKSVAARLRKHLYRLIVDAILLSNSTLCMFAGLKYSGAYRFVLFNFMAQLANPIMQISTPRVSSPAMKGGAVIIVAFGFIAMAASFTQLQGQDSGFLNIPSAALGFLFMVGATVFEGLRTKTFKRLTSKKIGNPRTVHAIVVMFSGLLQAPLGMASYLLGSGDKMGLTSLQYLFMILFIITFIVVFRFYITGIGKRALSQKSIQLDFVVCGLAATVLDVIQGAGACTIYSTCFALAAVFGVRLAVSKEKEKEKLPVYNPATTSESRSE
mmetsp:Transcript_24491/g.34234  ORF Transcript_24491/g.34234 Transcript_24491/m.34234 type:complete len:333 (+) Transcript_24491:46-1044(+)